MEGKLSESEIADLAKGKLKSKKGEIREALVGYEILKLEYPVLWTGMKSFPARGRGNCAMHST